MVFNGHMQVGGRTQFVSMYGVGPDMFYLLWHLIHLHTPVYLLAGLQEYHLSWTLMFLKLYMPEEAQAEICGTTSVTLRKWVRMVLKMLSNLPVVSKKGFDNDNIMH